MHRTVGMWHVLMRMCTIGRLYAHVHTTDFASSIHVPALISPVSLSPDQVSSLVSFRLTASYSAVDAHSAYSSRILRSSVATFRRVSFTEYAVDLI